MTVPETAPMKKPMLVLATVLACVGAGSAAAAGPAMSKEAYKAEKTRISAAAKTARARCGELKANARDICMAEAKGGERVAVARLEAQFKPTGTREEKARRAEADAAYDVAKERCDDRKGNAKEACQMEAKAMHTSALADIKRASKS
jgi:hypothetical protein